jgi:hypothetical protein
MADGMPAGATGSYRPLLGLDLIEQPQALEAHASCGPLSVCQPAEPRTIGASGDGLGIAAGASRRAPQHAASRAGWSQPAATRCTHTRMHESLARPRDLAQAKQTISALGRTVYTVRAVLHCTCACERAAVIAVPTITSSTTSLAAGLVSSLLSSLPFTTERRARRDQTPRPALV